MGCHRRQNTKNETISHLAPRFDKNSESPLANVASMSCLDIIKLTSCRRSQGPESAHRGALSETTASNCMFRSPQNLIRVDNEVFAVVACCDGLTVCDQLDVVSACTPELVPSLILNHDIIHITHTRVLSLINVVLSVAMYAVSVRFRVYWCSARYTFVDPTAHVERSLYRLSHR